ncbi:MAG: hypothetical protein RTV41_13855 [Candidatus Thorarchaeota archaeon]
MLSRILTKRLLAFVLTLSLLLVPLLTTTGSQFEALGHRSTNVFSLSQDSGIPYEGDDVLLQAGNSRPKFQFVPSPSDQIVADIRLGAGMYSAFTWRDLPNLDRSLNSFVEYGTKRIDTCVDEVEEPIYWEYNNEEEFPEEYDEFIDGLNENGVAVNYMLHFWDKTGYANGSELSIPRFQTEEEIQDFLDYVRFVVSHYKGRVQYYTIWSEPDAGGIKHIEPEDYIDLVRRTVPVIHEEDPQAKVSIAPNVLFFAQDYLSVIIESDIMTMVDVIQWHGIYNVMPNDPFFGDYYYQYPAIIEGIRQTAEVNGFDGEYWATEISYCSEEFQHCQGTGQPWDIPETDKQAAKYSSRAIVMHLGWDIGVAMLTWLPDVPDWAPWVHPTTSNLYKVLAGTRPISLIVAIEREPTNTLTYAFELSNGDTLFTLWTHGEAVDDDPGVSTTLTFPGLSAQRVIAIDVLNDFEQELIIEPGNGNLVIRNINVMDYPIILRIDNDTSSETTTTTPSWIVLPLLLPLFAMIPVTFIILAKKSQ